MKLYLLSTRFRQQHAQTARVLLIVRDQLAQRPEGNLVGHKISADGGALHTEVEHLPIAASWKSETRMKFNTHVQIRGKVFSISITIYKTTEGACTTPWLHRKTVLGYEDTVYGLPQR